jgi:hypothetical protein
LGTFTVTTEAGTEITADVWFRCDGVVHNSDYLGSALAPARRSDGFIEVGPTLQVAGQSTVFALGDTSTADSKMAGDAGRQATIVADNINALAQGRSDFTHYTSWGVAIAVPIGPKGGAGEFPGEDEIAGPEIIAERKGREMGVARLRERFGLVLETPGVIFTVQLRLRVGSLIGRNRQIREKCGKPRGGAHCPPPPSNNEEPISASERALGFSLRTSTCGTFTYRQVTSAARWRSRTRSWQPDLCTRHQCSLVPSSRPRSARRYDPLTVLGL